MAAEFIHTHSAYKTHSAYNNTHTHTHTHTHTQTNKQVMAAVVFLLQNLNIAKAIKQTL